MTDAVNNPAHYNLGDIEAIQVIKAQLGEEGFKHYCMGNVLKYSLRAGKKGEVEEDLAKGARYAHWLLNGLEEGRKSERSQAGDHADGWGKSLQWLGHDADLLDESRKSERGQMDYYTDGCGEVVQLLSSGDYLFDDGSRGGCFDLKRPATAEEIDRFKKTLKANGGPE